MRWVYFNTKPKQIHRSSPNQTKPPILLQIKKISVDSKHIFLYCAGLIFQNAFLRTSLITTLNFKYIKKPQKAFTTLIFAADATSVLILLSSGPGNCTIIVLLRLMQFGRQLSETSILEKVLFFWKRGKKPHNGEKSGRLLSKWYEAIKIYNNHSAWQLIYYHWCCMNALAYPPVANPVLQKHFLKY